MTTEAPSSPAPLGRRVVALAVDWGLATAISAGFLDNHPLATLGVFALMTWLLLATRGATIGHTLLGLRVRAYQGGAATPVQVLIRTGSLCLVIPAVVWGLDGRGLHDVWAGTQIVRR
ncbi:RDD family protein [Georgenia phoenicis]|uniref:RDD family protein n=1 Tax=unclassified Georgenia TaxID=2626815 RepID=UPI0039AECA35